jgi:hypothetical protein
MALPEISQTDLESFHAAHFSGASTTHFTQQFLGPVEEEYFEEVEDDGLGHYDDGVKRTLTDEQIAIFRHSEIHAILRDRRYAEEAGYDESGTPATIPEEGELEAGELEDDTPSSREFEAHSVVEEISSLPSTHGTSSKRARQKVGRKAKKAEQARQKGWYKQNVKPDLRKRTWDKVDSGVGNLDYEEDRGAAPVQNPVSQRRRISYDD